jgi:hypothetical protein
MYLDRRDYRGLVIVLSLLAFSAAAVFFIQTLDLPSGVYVGRRRLLEPQVGDATYMVPFAISLVLASVAALAASFRSIWER